MTPRAARPGRRPARSRAPFTWIANGTVSPCDFTLTFQTPAVVEHRRGDVDAAALRQPGPIEWCVHARRRCRTRPGGLEPELGRGAAHERDAALAAASERDHEPLRLGRRRRDRTTARAGRASASTPRGRGASRVTGGHHEPARRREPAAEERTARQTGRAVRGEGSGVMTSYPAFRRSSCRIGSSSRATVSRSRSSSAPGESLLSVLREQLGIVSVKDGCAPQGQCGCCTVLVDGEPRVACVTPVTRVAGRAVTTVEGLDARLRDTLAASFVATGGSQCGFCTPGIVVRAAALLAKGKDRRVDLDRALAAHLCRCTGWQTVYEAVDGAATAPAAWPARDLAAAAQRADARGRRRPAAVGAGRPARRGRVRRRHRAAATRWSRCRCPPGRRPTAERRRRRRGDHVGGRRVARSLPGRAPAKVQGRRTTVGGAAAARASRTCPPGGVRLVTGWVEPAYLEPDASWCEPGGEPASPLANGGAFGGKVDSPRRRGRTRAGRPTSAARCASCSHAKTSCASGRSDRRSPRAPCSTGTVTSTGVVVGGVDPFVAPIDVAVRRSTRSSQWSSVERRRARRPSSALRAVGLAEHAVLVEGALDEAGVDRGALVRDDRAASGPARHVRSGVADRSGTLAGARVDIDGGGTIAPGRGARRRGRSARRGRAALVRDRRRAHGDRVGAQRGLDRRPRVGRDARPDDPVVRRRSARRTRRRSTSRSSTTTGRRCRVRRTRCSPRSRLRHGTRSRAPTARGPTRSPRRARRAARSTTPLTSARRSHGTSTSSRALRMIIRMLRRRPGCEEQRSRRGRRTRRS